MPVVLVLGKDDTPKDRLERLLLGVANAAASPTTHKKQKTNHTAYDWQNDTVIFLVETVVVGLLEKEETDPIRRTILACVRACSSSWIDDSLLVFCLLRVVD